MCCSFVRRYTLRQIDRLPVMNFSTVRERGISAYFSSTTGQTATSSHSAATALLHTLYCYIHLH